MNIKEREIGRVSVLDCSGKITLGKGDVALRKKIQELVERERKAILVNLAKVSYMDSAGIGEMVACYKRVKDADGEIKLLNPSGKVYDLFQITKLDQIFETYQDEKEALVSF